MDKSNSTVPRILVIEDDHRLAEGIRSTLENEGYLVVLARSCPEGTNFLEQIKPDLLITSEEPVQSHLGCVLDRLTDRDGPPVVRIVQQANFPGSRWGNNGNKVGWLTSGFSANDLRSVIRLLHPQQPPPPVEKLEHIPEAYRDRRLSLDFANRRCMIYGREIRLSPTEFRLLAALVTCANQVVSQRQLLSTVWGPEYLTTASGDIVRQAVRSLRIKLRLHSMPAELIETVRGEGYTYSMRPEMA